ncbi:hypothetical protein DSECCO2_658770 [anaerobic digester metagenome]
MCIREQDQNVIRVVSAFALKVNRFIIRGVGAASIEKAVVGDADVIAVSTHHDAAAILPGGSKVKIVDPDIAAVLDQDDVVILAGSRVIGEDHFVAGVCTGRYIQRVPGHIQVFNDVGSGVGAGVKIQINVAGDAGSV